jgi:hypothetical protein
MDVLVGGRVLAALPDREVVLPEEPRGRALRVVVEPVDDQDVRALAPDDLRDVPGLRVLAGREVLDQLALGVAVERGVEARHADRVGGIVEHRVLPEGGRPPLDPVIMLKNLAIEAQHDFSDDRAEFLIPERLSFMRLPGIWPQDRVPGAETIRASRERLAKAGAIERPFRRSDAALREAGCIAMPGQTVHGTLAAAPEQPSTEGGREGGDRGRLHPLGLAEQAGQAPPDG